MDKCMVVYYIVNVCVLITVSGQIFRAGPCPKVHAVHVDWRKMQGEWFWINMFPDFHPALRNQKCLSEIKSLNRNGTSGVYVSNVNTKTGEYTQDLFAGTIIPNFYRPSVGFEPVLPNFPDYENYILDVDYHSYHLFYRCAEGGPDRRWSIEQAVYISRERRPLRRALYNRLTNILMHNNINPEFLETVDQNDCPERFPLPKYY